jgi:hypothetical protein
MRPKLNIRKQKKKILKKKNNLYLSTVSRILLNQRTVMKMKKIIKSLKIRISLKKLLSIINKYEIRKESLK